MVSWYYIFIIALPVLCFLFYKEWKRENKARLAARLLASVLAVVSLLWMAYPYATASDNISAQKIIILTDGYKQDSLQQFLKQANGNSSLFSADRSLIHANPGEHVQFIPDLSSFLEKHVNDTLQIVGNGFNTESLGALKNHRVVFHAPPAFAAVQSVSWTKKIKPGETFIVQGKYFNPLSTPVKIGLKIFAETLDSVFIPSQKTFSFALKTVPKHTGKTSYSLVAYAGNALVENDPLPVEITAAAPLKLLILSSAPDFENTFLKNRLAQNGYAISIQTIIAKEKSDKQFLNMQATNADRLSAAYLDQFDAMIADEDALKAISVAELSSINASMADKGLGLIIKLNGEKNNSSFYNQYFSSQKLDSNKKGSVAIYASGNDSSNYSLQLEEPTSIQYKPGAQILLTDKQSNVYAAVALYGQGKIIATALNNTYSLALAGNNQAYQSLWSLLLEKAAKKISPASGWKATPQFSFVNEPVLLTLESDNDQSTNATINGNNIYLQQNQLLPYQWRGVYWPQSHGWQALQQEDKMQYEWYAYKTGDWKKLLDLEKWQATKKYAATFAVSSKPDEEGMHRWMNNLPLFLLLIFLICCGFLWVEEKKV